MLGPPKNQADKDHVRQDGHPCYGTIELSNVTRSGGGMPLFGSGIQHSHVVAIKISTASLTRGIHRDIISPDKQIIEVYMSAHQWGEFVSSFGKGGGTPCTLSYVNGVEIEEMPEIRSPLDEIKGEFSSGLKALVEKVDAVKTKIKSIFEKPSVGKGDRKEIEDLIANIRMEIADNLPYIQTSFTQATERITSVQKAEIEATIAGRLRDLGMDKMAENQLEDHSPLALSE